MFSFAPTTLAEGSVATPPPMRCGVFARGPPLPCNSRVPSQPSLPSLPSSFVPPRSFAFSSVTARHRRCASSRSAKTLRICVCCAATARSIVDTRRSASRSKAAVADDDEDGEGGGFAAAVEDGSSEEGEREGEREGGDEVRAVPAPHPHARRPFIGLGLRPEIRRAPTPSAPCDRIGLPLAPSMALTLATPSSGDTPLTLPLGVAKAFARDGTAGTACPSAIEEFAPSKAVVYGRVTLLAAASVGTAVVVDSEASAAARAERRKISRIASPHSRNASSR